MIEERVKQHADQLNGMTAEEVLQFLAVTVQIYLVKNGEDIVKLGHGDAYVACLGKGPLAVAVINGAYKYIEDAMTQRRLTTKNPPLPGIN